MPNCDPTTLAIVSPIPTDNRPLLNDGKLNPAELVISQGVGCIHNGKEHPTDKYNGVSAIIPASFSSLKTKNPS